MTNTENPTAVLSMLALAGYADVAAAQRDNVAFVCVECGSTMSVQPTATSSREAQRDALHANYVIDCCGPEHFHLI